MTRILYLWQYLLTEAVNSFRSKGSWKERVHTRNQPANMCDRISCKHLRMIRVLLHMHKRLLWKIEGGLWSSVVSGCRTQKYVHCSVDSKMNIQVSSSEINTCKRLKIWNTPLTPSSYRECFSKLAPPGEQQPIFPYVSNLKEKHNERWASDLTFFILQNYFFSSKLKSVWD